MNPLARVCMQFCRHACSPVHTAYASEPEHFVYSMSAYASEPEHFVYSMSAYASEPEHFVYSMSAYASEPEHFVYSMSAYASEPEHFVYSICKTRAMCSCTHVLIHHAAVFVNEKQSAGTPFAPPPLTLSMTTSTTTIK